LPQKTYGFTVNPKNPKTLLVGGLDGKMYRSYNSGISWDTVIIAKPSITPLQLTNMYIYPPDTTIIIIGGINNGAIERTTNNGKTWEIAIDGKHPIEMHGESIIGDPLNPYLFYVADYLKRYILKSESGGDFWAPVSIVDGNEYFSTIVILPDGNTMFAGMDSGIIRKSTDVGKTWKVVANFTNGLYSGEVTSIVFSKKNPSVGYAVMTYSNSTATPNGGLYKTIDKGESWYNIGFRDTSLRTIAVRAYGYDDDIYVGGYSEPIYPSKAITGQGIVRHSTNGGISWEKVDNSIEWSGTAPHNVWAMKFVADTPLNDKLYMATEAGFFVMDVPVLVQEQEQIPITDEWNVRLVKGKLSVTIPNNFNSSSEYRVRLYSLLGEKIAEEVAVGNNEFSIKNYHSGVYSYEIMYKQTRKKLLLIGQ
jgi:photosystem II stability/assembly factor-like uncharacterized protein